jgi:hypothetical protein
MKEYMLLIRNEIDHQDLWDSHKHDSFLKSCEAYIKELKQRNKLISAQPMIREGKLLSGARENWNISPFNKSKEVIVGYYHILAENTEDALETAKANPEFEFSATASVEIRPLKMKESATGFNYPNKVNV